MSEDSSQMLNIYQTTQHTPEHSTFQVSYYLQGGKLSDDRWPTSSESYSGLPLQEAEMLSDFQHNNKNKQTLWLLVHMQTIPTEQLPLVGEF
jgi:hypothetical protein